MANTYPTHRPVSDKYLNAYMADVSTASSAFVPVPGQGMLVGIMSTIYVAITGADSAITVKINGTAVTGATLTIAQSGAAAGDVDSNFDFKPVAVKQGDQIEFISDGASSTTSPTMFTAVIREL